MDAPELHPMDSGGVLLAWVLRWLEMEKAGGEQATVSLNKLDVQHPLLEVKADHTHGGG
jgi:hypothetical protein